MEVLYRRRVYKVLYQMYHLMMLIVVNRGIYPPVIKHGVMEKGPCTDDFPMKPLIYGGFSIAMLDYKRVSHKKAGFKQEKWGFGKLNHEKRRI